MYALNFYSPIVADQLRSRRKTATIRLGDKSRKYKKGMVVQVLVGARYGPREKVFEAVIDKVEVKTLGELSPRDIEHDNPEARRPEELATFLGQLYNREVSSNEIVTLIRFSEMIVKVRRAPRHDDFHDDSSQRLRRASRIRANATSGWSRRAELGAAHLALDGEGGAEAGVALRAAGAHLSAAVRALSGQIALGLVEVALGEPARPAEGDPVAERLAPLLTQPVRSLAHGSDARRAGRMSA